MLKIPLRTLMAAVAFFALAVPLMPPVSGQADPAPWTIHETVHCLDEDLVEPRDIHILDGGALVLEGCTLRMDSPPYEDEWLNAPSEGLHIQVDEGGRLEMRHSGNRPSVLESQDERYGYTVDVEGTFISDGSADDPNRIRRLEGFMSEMFIDDGLEVTGPGRAYLNHTEVRDIFGPALYVRDGGSAHVRDVTVTNASGSFAVFRAELALSQARINTGIEGIRAADARLDLSGLELGTNRIAIHAVRSNVSIRDSDLLSVYSAGLVLTDSDASLERCRLRYGTYGLFHKTDGGATPSSIEVRDCVFDTSGQKSLAVTGKGARVSITNATFVNNTMGAVSILEGDLSLKDSRFASGLETEVFLQDATGMFSGNAFSANATRSVRIAYTLQVYAVERKTPLQGATVRLGDEAERATDANGSVTLTWEPVLDERFEPTEDSVQVTVSWKGRDIHKEASSSERRLVTDFAQSKPLIPGPSMALVAFGLLALAASASRRGS